MRIFNRTGGFNPVRTSLWRGLAVTAVVALLTGLCWGRDEGPDDKYLSIYKVIQKADALSDSGKTDQAHTNYLAAQAALAAFQREFPYWNAKLVAYRMSYVAQKLTAPAQPPPDTTAAGGGKSAGAAGNVPVKLLEPGAEPRKELRLHPAAGDKQAMEMTVKIGVENSMAGVETPAIKMPPMKLNFESTVKEVASNGDITYELVLTELNVVEGEGASPEMTAMMKTAFADVKNLSGTCTISSRGQGKALEMKPPAGANPQARQMLDQMKELYSQIVEPLPEEPVGVGAKWEVKRPIKSQGMNVNQTSTYELTALEGDQATIKATIIQEASGQKIQNPAMPGLKMDLSKMTSRGGGERLVDLTKLLPASGSGEVHTEMAMSMSIQGKAQSMSTKMDMSISLESK